MAFRADKITPEKYQELIQQLESDPRSISKYQLGQLNIYRGKNELGRPLYVDRKGQVQVERGLSVKPPLRPSSYAEQSAKVTVIRSPDGKVTVYDNQTNKAVAESKYGSASVSGKISTGELVTVDKEGRVSVGASGKPATVVSSPEMADAALKQKLAQSQLSSSVQGLVAGPMGSYYANENIVESRRKLAEEEQRQKLLQSKIASGTLTPEDIIPQGRELPLTPENIAAVKSAILASEENKEKIENQVYGPVQQATYSDDALREYGINPVSASELTSEYAYRDTTGYQEPTSKTYDFVESAKMVPQAITELKTSLLQSDTLREAYDYSVGVTKVLSPTGLRSIAEGITSAQEANVELLKRLAGNQQDDKFVSTIYDAATPGQLPPKTQDFFAQPEVKKAGEYSATLAVVGGAVIAGSAVAPFTTAAAVGTLGTASTISSTKEFIKNPTPGNLLDLQTDVILTATDLAALKVVKETTIGAKVERFFKGKVTEFPELAKRQEIEFTKQDVPDVKANTFIEGGFENIAAVAKADTVQTTAVVVPVTVERFGKTTDVLKIIPEQTITTTKTEFDLGVETASGKFGGKAESTTQTAELEFKPFVVAPEETTVPSVVNKKYDVVEQTQYEARIRQQLTTPPQSIIESKSVASLNIAQVDEFGSTAKGKGLTVTLDTQGPKITEQKVFAEIEVTPAKESDIETLVATTDIEPRSTLAQLEDEILIEQSDKPFETAKMTKVAGKRKQGQLTTVKTIVADVKGGDKFGIKVETFEEGDFATKLTTVSPLKDAEPKFQFKEFAEEVGEYKFERVGATDTAGDIKRLTGQVEDINNYAYIADPEVVGLKRKQPFAGVEGQLRLEADKTPVVKKLTYEQDIESLTTEDIKRIQRKTKRSTYGDVSDTKFEAFENLQKEIDTGKGLFDNLDELEKEFKPKVNQDQEVFAGDVVFKTKAGPSTPEVEVSRARVVDYVKPINIGQRTSAADIARQFEDLTTPPKVKSKPDILSSTSRASAQVLKSESRIDSTLVQDLRINERQQDKIIDDIKSASDARIRTQDIVKPTPDTRIRIKDLIKPTEDVRIRTDNKITTRDITTPRVDVPRTPRIRAPPKPPTKLPPDFNLDLAMKAPEGYDVKVKSGGKYIKVNKRPQSKEAALSLGEEYVDRTTARSFKLVKTTKPAATRESGYQYNPRKLRSSKRESNVYVEKSAYAIDTKGELEGITAKGLRARKQRAMNNYKVKII